MTPSSQYPSTHSVIMDDFRRLTIQPMLQATSSMRLTIEQSLETIASTRAALVTVNELAKSIDDALMHWRAATLVSGEVAAPEFRCTGAPFCVSSSVRFGAYL